MTEDQSKWLARFTGRPAGEGADPKEQYLLLRDAEESEEQALKEVYLGKVHQKLDGAKKSIQKAFTIELEVEGKKISTMGAGGDSTLAWDTEETSKTTKGSTMAEATASTRAMEIIAQCRTILETPKVKRSRLNKDKLIPRHEAPEESLFTDDEIADELYEPLVRELIIPENFVIHRFSKVQKMIEATNDLYLQELEDFVEEDDLAARLEDASKVVEIAGKLAGLDSHMGETTKMVVELSETVMKTVLEGAASVVKKEGSAGAHAMVDGVADIVGTILKSATGSEELATLVSCGMKTAAGGTIGILGPMLEEDEPDGEKILSNIAKMITSGFQAGAARISDEETKAIVESTGESVAAAFELAAKAKKDKLVANIKERKWTEVASFIGQAALAAGKQTKAVKNSLIDARFEKQLADKEKDKEDSDDEEERNQIDQEIKALKKEQKEAKELASREKEAFEGGGEAVEKLAKLKEAMAGEKGKDATAKAAKTAKAEEIQSAEKELKAAQEEYVRSLEVLGKSSPNEQDMKSIAKLVEQVKKDRATWAAVVAVAKGGTAVAAIFFEPMAIAGTIIKYLDNVAQARERAIALDKWLQSEREAESAVSPYKSSIRNFVKNQMEQMGYHFIKAALNLIQIGSQIAATGFPAAKVVSTATAAAESLGDLAYKYFQERAVKAAWELTKRALDNRNNRKLALIARRQNPTLAKYSIAYGALVQKDHVAISALNKCGLDRETLANKSSNVAAVKSYLETLFPEDRVVKGEVKSEWLRKLPDPELSVKVWALTCKRAADQKKLTGSAPPEIATLLKKIERHAAAEKTLTDDKFGEFIADLSALGAAFDRFASQATPDMREVITGYRDLIEAEGARVTELRSLRFGAVKS